MVDPAPRPGGRFRPDEGAQLMVLSAVVLLVGFLALTTMVAKVQNLPQETARERDDAFPSQAGQVHAGAADLVERLAEYSAVTPQSNAQDRDDIEQGMAIMASIMGAHGVWMEPVGATYFTLCAGGALTLEYQLGDGANAARFEQSFTGLGTFCD